MRYRCRILALLALGPWVWMVSANSSAHGAPLLIMQGDYPRAYFFRSAEGQAANTNNTYAEWDATFSRLMGIEGKVFDEEVPGRMARNPQFFAQFKSDHPNQLVLLHFNGRARDPAFETSNYFAGHWIYHNGAMITADVPAQSADTDIHVSDTGLFLTNMGRYGTNNDDIGLCALNAQGKPDWSQSEQVTLVSVDELAGRFGAGGLCETFDGVEFDVLMYNLGNSNATRGPDCDADGAKDAGVIGGFNVYGAGVIEFCRELRQKMGEGKFIMADGMGEGNQRAVGILNGIESEGWPALSDSAIDDWSGGINRHFFWEANGRAPVFNYINHKFTVPGGSGQQQEVPYSTHRLVFAAAHFLNAGICYSYTPPKTGSELVGVWDEFWKGTAHEIGWLGQPLGPARRLAEEQPDVFGGAGSPATSAILSKFAGTNMTFTIDGGRVKVTATGGATELGFNLKNVPLSGPDIYLSITAHGDPLPGYPPEMPRVMTVKSTEGITTPTEHMTWANGQDFTSTFYYGDVIGATGKFHLTVEGTGPIWLTLTGRAHPDAVVREFEHGAIVANPSLHDYAFDLASLFPGQSFRRFQGTALQDPATNNGALISSPLTLHSKDALFMVKEPQSAVRQWREY
ncbi:MAG: hypothetical protein NTW86_16730 [Candidatus Sumerlaeota bacterium]|nr:hypothetical protein [Candidatus Sumerlaeota bacterium]